MQQILILTRICPLPFSMIRIVQNTAPRFKDHLDVTSYIFHYKFHIDIQYDYLYVPAMKGAPTEKIMTMKDLTQARQRYQRLLDALGHTSCTDRELRMELMDAIDNIDRKIGLLSHASSCEGSR